MFRQPGLNANLISKIYFPRVAVPLASTLSGLLDFSISFLVLLAVSWPITAYFQQFILCYYPCIYSLQLLTALGFGLWLSALNVRYRDINQLTPFIIQIWMYITPVVYAVTLIPERFRFMLSPQPDDGGCGWIPVGFARASEYSKFPIWMDC
jgi:lipopolysaccharide transport system permease protein